MKYNLVIASAPNHFEMVERNKELYFKNLPINRIIVIGSSKGEKFFAGDDRITLMDEEKLYPGLGMLSVRRLVENQGGHMTRSNWYFQQFLKMAYACCCEDDYYIVWDADTVPVRPIKLFEDGKPLFSYCDDYFKDYFETLEKLFHGTVKKQSPHSFIVEHMVIKTEYMKEMIQEIENDVSLKGRFFFEKIISVIDREAIKKAGFSEFETYANYVLTRHQEAYGIRKLQAFRYGLIITGYKLDQDMVNWLAKSRDTISLEHFCRPSIWRFRWLNPETYRTKTVDDVWNAYQGSFFQKTDLAIKYILDKKKRICYLISRIPYRIRKICRKEKRV